MSLIKFGAKLPVGSGSGMQGCSYLRVLWHSQDRIEMAWHFVQISLCRGCLKGLDLLSCNLGPALHKVLALSNCEAYPSSRAGHWLHDNDQLSSYNSLMPSKCPHKSRK